LKNYIIEIQEFFLKFKITTTKEYSSRVHSDLTKRSATEINLDTINDIVTISASVPLAKLAHYSSEIRKITSGNTTFTIQFDSYKPISQKEYQELLNKKKL
jgi:translation elongation factor EF-G